MKGLVDFQNVDADGREAFARIGGRSVPALWDGVRLHEGAAAIRLALSAIIPA
ncbi:MAG TPA: hypothetical protein VGA16_11820 [Candidatus Limnocylindria bacterium]